MCVLWYTEPHPNSPRSCSSCNCSCKLFAGQHPAPRSCWRCYSWLICHSAVAASNCCSCCSWLSCSWAAVYSSKCIQASTQKPEAAAACCCCSCCSWLSCHCATALINPTYVQVSTKQSPGTSTAGPASQDPLHSVHSQVCFTCQNFTYEV